MLCSNTSSVFIPSRFLAVSKGLGPGLTIVEVQHLVMVMRPESAHHVLQSAIRSRGGQEMLAGGHLGRVEVTRKRGRSSRGSGNRIGRILETVSISGCVSGVGRGQVGRSVRSLIIRRCLSAETEKLVNRERHTGGRSSTRSVRSRLRLMPRMQTVQHGRNRETPREWKAKERGDKWTGNLTEAAQKQPNGEERRKENEGGRTSTVAALAPLLNWLVILLFPSIDRA